MLYQLFTYQPNQHTRIYALTYRGDITFIRVMDYQHQKQIDNPTSPRALTAIAHLANLIMNGLRPIAHFARVDNAADVMPYFRFSDRFPLIHDIGMLYIPGTLNYRWLLAQLYRLFAENTAKHRFTGRVLSILERCNSIIETTDFQIKYEYAVFHRLDAVLPRSRAINYIRTELNL